MNQNNETNNNSDDDFYSNFTTSSENKNEIKQDEIMNDFYKPVDNNETSTDNSTNDNVIVNSDNTSGNDTKFKSMLGKNRLFKILFIIIVLIITTTVSVLVLAELKIIKLPWLDYPEILVLSQNEVTIKNESKFQFSSYVYPSQVNYGRIIYESSDPTVADVNPITGYVETKKNGVATIKAYLEDYHDIQDSCNVVVSNNDVLVESIKVANDNIDMLVGGTYLLKYEYFPKDAGLHYFSYSSSDTSIVKINNNGEVTAVNPGRAVINIMEEISGQTIEQEITVYESNNKTQDKYVVSSIKVSQDEVTLTVGGEYKVIANVYPEDVVQSITWSSLNSDIASVSNDGLITANDYGKTQIIATAVDGTNKVINVIVQEEEIPMVSLEITKSINMYVGDKKRIDTFIEPKNATDQKVIWRSINPDVATVDQSGNVTAISVGTATIKAMASEGSLIAETNIVVSKNNNEIKIKEFKLSKNNVTVNQGSSVNVDVTIVPSNASNRNLTWTSANNNIATVSNGMIYGKSAGTTYIDVKTSNGITRRIQVVVNSIVAKSISLNQTSVKLGKGGAVKLYATFKPANASNKNITWTSNNTSVASVNKNGQVTTHNTGIAVITATTRNGKTAKCTITVTNDNIPISTIALSSKQYIIKVNEKLGITAIINPTNATNQKLKITSSNPNIANVESDGRVKGIREGVVEITATTNNGKKATAFLIVKNKNSSVNYIEGTTIKYWYDNTFKNYGITHIWVRDAYKQFKTEIPDKFGTLANANTLSQKAARKNSGKTLISINGSGFVTESFGKEMYQVTKEWKNTSVSPIVIYEGKVLRDFTKLDLNMTENRIFAMNSNKNLSIYSYSKKKEENAGKVNELLNNGVKYTFSFRPVLVNKGVVNTGLSKDNNIRQSICQIDQHNFLFISNITSNRSNGFSYNSLANKMVELGCKTGFNLDGGGSMSIYYVKKGTTTPTKIRVMEGNFGRSIADIVYFVGD